MNEAEKLAITERAVEQMRAFTRPIVLEMNIGTVVDLIGVVQLALRHPQSGKIGASLRTEKLIRVLIEQIDPLHSDLYKLLMMGFDPQHDV